MTGSHTTSGLIVKRGRHLRFVPMQVAQRVVSRPVVSAVPGTAIGMALIAGRVIPVIEVGPTRDQLLLCNVAGQDVGLSGLAVVSSGFFEQEGGHVRYADEWVPTLDVAGELGRIEHWLSARRPQVGGEK